ncbi:MAG TPA: hypothetical protein VK116_12580, partial [Planctomycetota bacterium]|nr:hypothetical protein [Planctomycetota bacterium]
TETKHSSPPSMAELNKAKDVPKDLRQKAYAIGRQTKAQNQAQATRRARLTPARERTLERVARETSRRR